MEPCYSNIILPDEFKEALFNEVLDLDWLTERSARKEYFMSDVPREYSYGNRNKDDVVYKSQEFTEQVSRVLRILNVVKNYNVCFLNRYENEKQHLGWHADDFPGMDSEHPIVVVSLGAEREIYWKEQGFKGEVPDSNKQLLEHGSIWTMPGGFQEKYFHKIPKHDKPCGIRISLTFRSFLT